MSRMEEHWVKWLPGEQQEAAADAEILAYIKPASLRAVDTVMNASEDDEDGRSNWVWVRLPNGDLILGVYPQGDTYFETEYDHS